MQNSFKNKNNTLFLVATPIGNLGEISQRAIETLTNASVIACEDTRVTGLLLSKLGIKKKMISFADHNSKSRIPQVIEYLADGDVALVSDAGMPLISDPGYDLVTKVCELNYNVVAISGPTAFVNALVISGLDTNRFYFHGFLNNKKSKRVTELKELDKRQETLIFYESPNRINAMLEDLHQVFGERKVAVSRELTKMHESIIRDTLPVTVETEKGEFVVVVEGAKEKKISEKDVIERINHLRKNGETNKEILNILISETKWNRNDIYKLIHDKMYNE